MGGCCSRSKKPDAESLLKPEVNYSSNQTSNLGIRTSVAHLKSGEEAPTASKLKHRGPSITNRAQLISSSSSTSSSGNHDMKEEKGVWSTLPQPDDNLSPSEDEMLELSKCENLMVRGAGFGKVNGEYRWFTSAKAYCMFSRDSPNYMIKKHRCSPDLIADVSKVNLTDTRFEEEEDVWLLCSMTDTTVYYIAHSRLGCIPNGTATQPWVSVHGSAPCPTITRGLLHSAESESMLKPDDFIRRAGPTYVLPPDSIIHKTIQENAEDVDQDQDQPQPQLQLQLQHHPQRQPQRQQEVQRHEKTEEDKNGQVLLENKVQQEEQEQEQEEEQESVSDLGT